MALTTDEEDDLRALLRAVRGLPDVTTRSAGVKDGPTRVALDSIEAALRAIVRTLTKV